LADDAFRVVQIKITTLQKEMAENNKTNTVRYIVLLVEDAQVSIPYFQRMELWEL